MSGHIREHEAASEHPLTLAAKDKADKAVTRLRKSYRTKAARLEAKATQLQAEASELSYLADRYNEYETPYATLRSEIEDAGYWAARYLIGTFPRDAGGAYIEPAPMWRVYYDGQSLGDFQAEERTDVLNRVCPQSDPRKWHDFTVELLTKELTQ